MISMSRSKSKDDEDELDEKVKGTKKKSGYDYLLSMPLWSLTWEKVEKLKKEREEKEVEVKQLIDTPIGKLWSTDLDAFLQALDDWYQEEDAIEKEGILSVKRKVGKRKPRKIGTKKAQESFEDDDYTVPRKTAGKEVKLEYR